VLSLSKLQLLLKLLFVLVVVLSNSHLLLVVLEVMVEKLDCVSGFMAACYGNRGAVQAIK
jgi:hypothetical protein